MPIIFVDADACPVRQEVYRVARRYSVHITLVADSWMRVPKDDTIELVVVEGDFDASGDGYAVNGYTAVFMCSMTGLATVSNCIFTDNPGRGLLTYGNNSVSDCVFLDHGSTSVLIEPGGQTILSGCIFENGIGPGLSFYDEWYGGGHPPHEVLDCVFRGMGGIALSAWWESPLVEECLFVDNNGPALRLNSSSAIVRDCTIVSNNSTSCGAIDFTLSGHHSAQNNRTITNCIIAFNSCAGSVSGAPDYSVLDLNCFFENAGGDSLVGRAATRSTIFEDPLFCDYTG